MTVSLVITLLAGCGTVTNEEIDSQTVTQSETDAPTTETESINVSEEIVTEEESEAMEETIPEATEEPKTTTEPTETAEPEPQYTYTDLSQTMYAKQSVNVRYLPSTDGKKLGGLSTAQEVSVTGQCNETSWYRIEYNGSVGYVSNKYLVDEKPAVEVAPPAEQSQTNNTQGSGTYTNNWGQTYHMTLEDVKNATSCELGQYITTDEDNHVYYYMIVSHIRDVPGDGYDDVFLSAFELLQSKGYSKCSGPVEDVETYDNGNWLIQRVHMYGE